MTHLDRKWNYLIFFKIKFNSIMTWLVRKLNQFGFLGYFFLDPIAQENDYNSIGLRN